MAAPASGSPLCPKIWIENEDIEANLIERKPDQKVISYYREMIRLGDEIQTKMIHLGIRPDYTFDELTSVDPTPEKIKLVANGGYALLFEDGLPIKFLSPLGSFPLHHSSVRVWGINEKALMEYLNFEFGLTKLKVAFETPYEIYALTEDGDENEFPMAEVVENDEDRKDLWKPINDFFCVKAK